MSGTRPEILGVHFVGSLPLQSSEEVFSTIGPALPGRLFRIPDGETGKRYSFVQWQNEVFSPIPQVLRIAAEPIEEQSGVPFYQLSEEEKARVLSKVPALRALGKMGDESPPTSSSNVDKSSIIDNLPTLKTQFDDYALLSYSTFNKIRSEGLVDSHVRFQVSLPTPLAVIANHISPDFQRDLEPRYEQALMSALNTIQNQIPASDLAIQWDVAFENGMLEKFDHPVFEPWFAPLQEGIVDRLVRLVSAVDPEVEVGLHFCYGDRETGIFLHPTSLRVIAEVFTAVRARVIRNIDWVHVPVPRERDDESYFSPLSTLCPDIGRVRAGKERHTQLFLGLVHGGDEEGTTQAITSAGAVFENFGIATECGMGRIDRDKFDSVLDICRKAAPATA